MSVQDGVIETSSGNLLRYGKGVDFLNDGSFDSGTESIRNDVPALALRVFQSEASQNHNWNGSAWVLVSQPSRVSVLDLSFETVLTIEKLPVPTSLCVGVLTIISDDPTIGDALIFCDGVNWRRVMDNGVVA